MSIIRLSETESKQFISRLFVKMGAIQEHADIIADHLTIAELRGQSSHGLSRIIPYTEKVEQGGYKINPNIHFLKETKSTALLDADDAFGMVSATLAMKTCMEKAKQTGCATVAVTHSNHCGFMAYYTQMAAKQNMIGFAICNAASSTSVWGTSSPVLGTNPFSIAVPTSTDYPVVLDCATSVVAQGKVAVAQIENQPIPDNWAYDITGKPTTDAAKALAGTMRPFGDYKGSGLAILISLVCCGLTGVSFDMEPETLRRVHDMTSGSDLADVFCAIDISAFTDPVDFCKRTDFFINTLKNFPLNSSFDEILMPGEKEFRNIETFTKQGGFTIGSGLFGKLKNICEKYELDYDVDTWVKPE